LPRRSAARGAARDPEPACLRARASRAGAPTRRRAPEGTPLRDALTIACAPGEPAMGKARAALQVPRFEAHPSVRLPPPEGRHRIGPAEVWAPLPVLAHAVPGPAPLSAGVITMLHGACGAPLPVCAGWSGEATDDSWLVCPMGNAHCDDGGLDWRG